MELHGLSLKNFPFLGQHVEQMLGAVYFNFTLKGLNARIQRLLYNLYETLKNDFLCVTCARSNAKSAIHAEN